jgi:hypothetical protein
MGARGSRISPQSDDDTSPPSAEQPKRPKRADGWEIVSRQGAKSMPAVMASTLCESCGCSLEGHYFQHDPCHHVLHHLRWASSHAQPRARQRPPPLSQVQHLHWSLELFSNAPCALRTSDGGCQSACAARRADGTGTASPGATQTCEPPTK